MLKLFKEWWHANAWRFVTVIIGKMHQHEHCSSGAIYWCYYNDKLKQFRINVGHVKIVGKCEYYPSDDFFLPFIFHEDFDSDYHNSTELAEQRKLSNDFLEKVKNVSLS